MLCVTDSSGSASRTVFFRSRLQDAAPVDLCMAVQHGNQQREPSFACFWHRSVLVQRQPQPGTVGMSFLPCVTTPLSAASVADIEYGSLGGTKSIVG